MMQKFTTSDGIQIAYSDEGEGTPILCLAGLTRNGRDFDYVAAHLDARLIRMDYRGRGKSDWADPATYTIPREAQDAVELLDHLGLEKVAVLGTSRGGIIGMVLGVMAKERLLGIALNDIGPDIDPKGIEVIMNYLGRNPSWKTYDEAAQKRAAAMTGFSNVPLSRWREEVEKLYTETPDGLRITYDPKLRDAVEMSATGLTPDLWPMFDALDGLPLAAIRGENSDILSTETLNEMQHRRPDMRVAVVPDRAHIPFLDETEALTALHNWLKDIA